jgi:hypothetical protein
MNEKLSLMSNAKIHTSILLLFYHIEKAVAINYPLFKKKKKRIQRSCVQSVYTNTKFAVALPQYTRSSQ